MVWLYVPGLACSTKDSELHASFLDSNTVPFATWSGKPLLPRSLSRSWKTERLTRRLSGLTCSPSTAQRGAAVWIASLLASPAKTYPSPVAAQASMASGPVSSSMSSKLRTLAVRSNSFWRTSQGSLLQPPPLWTRKKAISKNAPPPASWENWPTAGGMRNGSLFQRPTLALDMAAHAGSVMPGEWLTPNVPNGGRSVSAELVASKGTTSTGEKRTVGLESQAKHWPTPDASATERTNRSISDGAAIRPTIALAAKQWLTPHGMSGTGKDGRPGGGGEFAKQVTAWPSPRASDAAKGGPNQRGSRGDLMLPSMAAQWPTPNAHDGRRPGVDLSSTQGGNLNRDAAAWPTPMAADHRGSAGADKAELPNRAMAWPTPASRDFRTPNSQESQESRNHSGGEQLPNFVEHHFSHPVLSTIDGRELSPTGRTLPRRLNPAFACWLMGWPTWWTNPAVTNSVKSEMALYRSKLQRHLCSLFAVPASNRTAT